MSERQVYTVLIDTPARKTLARLPRDLQVRLVNRIELLADNPRPHGAIKLKGSDAYRLRVGDYRVIYSIADERLVVLVVEVGHRREIYRNL